MSTIVILMPILMLIGIVFKLMQDDEQNAQHQIVPIPIEVDPVLTTRRGNHDS